MGKIQGWEKFQFDSGNQRWRSLVRRSHEVRVAGQTRFTTPVGKWFVEIPRRGGTSFFSTQKQALNFATRWMKSHPNG